MAFHVSDPTTDAAVRRLAALKGKGITETIREAVQAELRRTDTRDDFKAGLRALQRDAARLPDVDTRPVRAIRDDLNDGL